MIVFWSLAALASALAACLVLGAARVRVAAAGDDVAEGRRELDELDRLKARGLLEADAHAAARAEAGRRLLAETAAGPRPPVAGRGDRPVVLGAVLVCVAATLGLYLATGSPGLPDQGFERRVDEWATRPETLEPAQLAAVAARVADSRPGDPQALAMLGVARFEAGDPLGAASAFRRLLAIRPDDAATWARLGESLVRANEDRIGADAEAAFAEALKRDSGQLGARFFLGEAALRRGDADRARELWTPLIAALDPGDPRRQDLERRLPGGGS